MAGLREWVMGGPHCNFSYPPTFQHDLGNQQLGPRRAKPHPAMHMDCQENVDPGVARSLQSLEWFALRTRPRHEKVVTQQLETSGVEAFLPICDQVRTWSDRKKVVEFPLFPGYVFVRTSRATPARVRIFQARGVLGFVGPNNQGTPIPPQQIESVRALMQKQVHCRPHPYLTVGQRVRIQDGALKGLEGILVRVASDQSLIVSVDLIQRSVAIRLEGYEVDGL